MMDANAHPTATACNIQQTYKMVCNGLIVVMSRVRDVFANDIVMISKIWPT